MTPRSPFSITGFGLLSAAGVGIDQTRKRLFHGQAQDPQLLDGKETGYFKFRAHPEWLDCYDLPRDFFTPNLFLLMATEEALAMAGLTPQMLHTQRVGVCLGSTAGCSNFNETFADAYNRDLFPTPEALGDFFRTNSSQFLARRLGLKGPVMMLNNACTSGADAIGVAANWLENDVCDLVICGGTESVIQRVHFGFRSLMLCSPVPCKPFDRKRQGLTLGEGAGVMILERQNSPRPAQAQLLGYGSGSDSFHPTSPHPEARGLDLAVTKACEQAGLKINQIDLINAHGTGTPHNDLTEGRWIMQHAPQALVSATKGYTGHTLGAAGAIEALLAILCLQAQEIPSSIGFDESDPEIGLSPVRQITRGKFHTALSFSLGFGGTNSAVCLGRAT